MSEENNNQEDMDKKNQKHKKAMQKQKEKVDAKIESADEERGVLLVLTGNGKGKSSSGFGMVLRALGYDHKVGVVQFIKGVQLSGEEIFLKEKASLLPNFDEEDFYQMGTGFTWNTQDRTADIEAAEKTWAVAEKMLQDDRYNLVLLDELTYMIAYKYLDEERVLKALRDRPREMSVVVTGRGGGSALQELADTVSEIKDVKHAYKAGVKARKGVDF